MLRDQHSVEDGKVEQLSYEKIRTSQRNSKAFLVEPSGFLHLLDIWTLFPHYIKRLHQNEDLLPMMNCSYKQAYFILSLETTKTDNDTEYILTR